MRDGTKVFHSSTADFTYIVKGNGQAAISRCTSIASVVHVPEFIDGYRVTSFGPSSFSGLANMAELRCPQTLRSIGSFAFRDCVNLMTVEFPDLLDKFDIGWIEGCSRLRKVVFPGRAQMVPAQLFERFDVHDLHLGAGTKSVCVPHHNPISLDILEIDAANPWLSMDGCGLYGSGGEELIARIELQGCAGEVAEKASLGHLGPAANNQRKAASKTVYEGLVEYSHVRTERPSEPSVFGGACHSRFCIADGCRRIGPFALANQLDLVDVELPDTVEVIGEGAFAGSSALSHVTLPASLVEIGPAAFAGTRGLVHIEIPPSVERIGTGAFADTPAVERIVLPAAVCADALQAAACVSECPWETMAACDAAIGLIQDAEIRARLAIVRLKDPLFMSQREEALLRSRLSDDLLQLCRRIAESGEFSLYDDLVDVGVIDADAIVEVVEDLSPRRHGDAIARLLQIKHVRFENSQPDYKI